MKRNMYFMAHNTNIKGVATMNIIMSLFTKS